MRIKNDKLQQIVQHIAKTLLEGWKFREIINEEYYDEPNADGNWESYETVDYCFFKSCPEFQQVISLQSGKYGTYFLIEIGISVPDCLWRSDPEAPSIGSCILRERLNNIMELDHVELGDDSRREWYNFDDEPVDDLIALVKKDLERYIIPRITEVETWEKLVSRCIDSGNEFEKISAALLLAKHGDLRGEAIFAEVMKRKMPENWQNTYKNAAKRCGLIKG